MPNGMDTPLGLVLLGLLTVLRSGISSSIACQRDCSTFFLLHKQKTWSDEASGSELIFGTAEKLYILSFFIIMSMHYNSFGEKTGDFPYSALFLPRRF